MITFWKVKPPFMCTEGFDISLHPYEIEPNVLFSLADGPFMRGC